jgi:hypothetical protein
LAKRSLANRVVTSTGDANEMANECAIADDVAERPDGVDPYPGCLPVCDIVGGPR